ncbi:chaplin [Streptomyces sp. NPDC051561]|uniref:chaplin n=1 Tax=Streptomyces sp. NPDC051561 TaxID=3365658 RepID=UPI003792BB5D
MKRMKVAAVIAGSLMALGAASPAMADAGADAAASNSPGVLSGNVVQVPVHVPVNVCGNSINVIALLNPAFGNTCVNK